MQARTPDNLDPPLELMDNIWRTVASRIAAYRRDVSGLRVAPKIDLQTLRQSLEALNFEEPRDWEEMLCWVDTHMREDQMHTGHSRYFGLFNPAPMPLGQQRMLWSQPTIRSWQPGAIALFASRWSSI